MGAGEDDEAGDEGSEFERFEFERLLSGVCVQPTVDVCKGHSCHAENKKKPGFDVRILMCGRINM